MKLRYLAVAGLALTMAGAVPARAAVHLTMTFRGTVGQIDGGGGIRGLPSAGDAYTLVYSADFSKGLFGGGGGGFGSSTFLLGGSSETPDPSAPNLLISPITATLYINGHSLSFPGAYLGSVTYVQNSSDVPSGGKGQSWANFTAEDRAPDGSPLASITSAVNSDTFHTFGDVSVEQPVAVAIDGAHITASSAFSIGNATAGLSGVLKPTSYSAVLSAVPEPSSWMQMIMGAGLIGAALRRRRNLRGSALPRMT